MEEKLYKLMDWREIEGIIYADTDHPEKVLGSRMTKDGRLIMAFVPDSIHADVKLENGKKYEMEQVDEAGIYAALLPKRSTGKYRIAAEYAKGVSFEYYDGYQFASTIDEKDLKKYNAGVNYEIYKVLGAHPMIVEGVQGVRFAVWAPNATRVSVVGDFNFWDGRRNIMSRRGESGVFELFIPNIEEGTNYKYEIANWAGSVVLKSDPFATAAEYNSDGASKVWAVDDLQWSDGDWMEKRSLNKNQPVNIYEVHLGSWKQRQPEDEKETSDVSLNYREIAPVLAEYVKELGYTHIELLPVMEYREDESCGYQTSSYYAPSGRFGTPDDFAYFIDYMHKNNIGVILDWVPTHFPMDESGLGRFDGTALYEHQDWRQGTNKHWGTYLYNYARPEVSSFLISNAIFWAEVYHADGLRLDDVGSMLYLDFGKNNGEWIPNIYGGKENLDAIDFIKQLNKVMKKNEPTVMMIAEESALYPKVTGDVKEDGLGFDYLWNTGWMNDFIGYLQTDTYFRHLSYGNLSLSMVYAYSEDFVLPFSHEIVSNGKGSMFGKMTGDTDEKKYANLRLAYGYQMVHPGKKLLFMGQEFAQYNEWWQGRQLDWFFMEKEQNQQVVSYVKALNKLYISEPALYEMDYEEEGFEWINNISSDESIIVFARKSKNKDDMLVVICNFDTMEYEDYKIGVPENGKYKEIFNSDDEKYGGMGKVNPRIKQAKEEECDGREYSIRLKVPALGMTILKYTPAKQTQRRKSSK